MTLAAFIRGKRKAELAEFATAIPATAATKQGKEPGTVATIATIAVANPPEATASMTAGEETAIRAWLAHIEETDPDIIDDTLTRCRTNPEALTYFLERAGAVEVPLPDDDDRRCCSQCANLSGRGVCLAAKRGEIISGRNYQPVRDLPRRCEDYRAGG